MLQRQIDGQPLVYLDSANTSQKPRSVIDAMTDVHGDVVRADQPQRVPARRRGTDAYEGAAQGGQPVHQRADAPTS